MTKAEKTRKYILEKAFSLIYANGYQATSIDNIIDTTSVTKGALFYHFKGNKEIDLKPKEEMGLAVINEVIYPNFKAALIDPLNEEGQPMDLLYQTIKNFLMQVSEEQLMNGCPTNNLIQEMAPLNDLFKDALLRILNEWKLKIIQTLSQAAKLGIIREHNFEESAQFIIASYEGTRGLGKLHRTYHYYERYLRQLKSYLDSMK